MGLGNPGPEYEDTRHNAGFLLADRLVSRWQLARYRRGHCARESEGTWQGLSVRILKPQTYMNRSGAALAPRGTIPEFDPSQHLLVLVDDVALPVGRFRLRGAGSAGGHNGLKSIEGQLQRQDYARLRIGIGPPPPAAEGLSDFVLGPFSAEEREVIEGLLDPMSEAVEAWLQEGIEIAMNRFNR